MPTLIAELREVLVPRLDGRHGPLPPMLVVLTLVTGLVDAFSYLVLGHVFVANMTGNVVFLGFALAGAKGFSIGASATAVAAFSCGALGGGHLARRCPANRGHLLAVANATQGTLVTGAVVLVAIVAPRIEPGSRYGLVVLLALAMGIQNAVVRHLGVADLTTTVLTLTMVGIAADSVVTGGPRSRAGRRAVSIIAMFLGALLGAALVLRVAIALPLGIALALIAAIGVASFVTARRSAPWTVP